MIIITSKDREFTTFDDLHSDMQPGEYACIMPEEADPAFHRVVEGAEDAGFEVRDALLWLHSRGQMQVALVRKPCAGATIDNVIEHGIGGLNIDACRVPIADTERATIDNRSGAGFGVTSFDHIGRTDGLYKSHSAGRFPANLLHDGSVDDGFPESSAGRFPGVADRKTEAAGFGMTKTGTRTESNMGDTGTAARFFVTAADQTALVTYLKRLLEQPPQF